MNYVNFVFTYFEKFMQIIRLVKNITLLGTSTDKFFDELLNTSKQFRKKLSWLLFIVKQCWSNIWERWHPMWKLLVIQFSVKCLTQQIKGTYSKVKSIFFIVNEAKTMKEPFVHPIGYFKCIIPKRITGQLYLL